LYANLGNSAVSFYCKQSAFNYIDTGLDISNRTWIIFQVYTNFSDVYVALGTQKFLGQPLAAGSPNYEIVFDWVYSGSNMEHAIGKYEHCNNINKVINEVKK